MDKWVIGNEVFPFTATFPQGKIAIIKVHGADFALQARITAEMAFNGTYSVEEGDITNGWAEAFHCYVQQPKDIRELPDKELETMLEVVRTSLHALQSAEPSALSAQEHAEYTQTLQLGYRLRDALQVEQLRRLAEALTRTITTLKAKYAAHQKEGPQA